MDIIVSSSLGLFKIKRVGIEKEDPSFVTLTEILIASKDTSYVIMVEKRHHTFLYRDRMVGVVSYYEKSYSVELP